MSDSNTDNFRVCHDQLYPAEYRDAAWQEIFEGTSLAGKGIDEVWEMYPDSDLAYLSSYAGSGKRPELLSRCNTRAKLR